jgi:2-hydroxy-3-keto-5-methylthiopentenyl-1-phosphate phosphatase
MKKPLRIGFDLDGVLLYNPARTFRPVTLFLKKLLNKQYNPEKVHFYYPKTPLEQYVWRMVHWTSIFVSPGMKDIIQLVKEHKAEVFIVTSRYDCLKDDFQKWLNKMEIKNHLVEAYHNKNNIQPHLFKEKKINELNLDYFVEDNWDIVRHINKNTKTKGIWISNMLDKNIEYKYKFFSLVDAVKFLKKQIEKNT